MSLSVSLRPYPPACLTTISDEELIAGYRDMLAGGEDETASGEEADTELLTGDDEWRYPEFRCIRETRTMIA